MRLKHCAIGSYGDGWSNGISLLRSPPQKWRGDVNPCQITAWGLPSASLVLPEAKGGLILSARAITGDYYSRDILPIGACLRDQTQARSASEVENTSPSRKREDSARGPRKTPMTREAKGGIREERTPDQWILVRGEGKPPPMDLRGARSAGRGAIISGYHAATTPTQRCPSPFLRLLAPLAHRALRE